VKTDGGTRRALTSFRKLRPARLGRMILLCGGLMAAVLDAAEASEPQTIEIATVAGVPLSAVVFRPDAGKPVKGALVALHGCTGLFNTGATGAARLNSRYLQVARLATQEGFVAVFPDSLASRGVREICTRSGADKVTFAMRRGDARAAMRWVASQGYAYTKNTVLVGWSHGGGVALSVINTAAPLSDALIIRPSIVVGFYPLCGPLLRTDYRPTGKLVLLLGAKDDWAPAAPCMELAGKVGGDAVLFKDSHHGFDGPDTTLRTFKGAWVGNDVFDPHYGGNEEARRGAMAKMRSLLRSLRWN
jgi:dienelactone hydrolase